MAEALGGRWVKAGHDVMVGGRSPDRAAEVAARIGASAGSLQEATTYGEVLLLAVPAEVAVPVLTGLEIEAGRILIDCTNAVNQQDFTLDLAMAEVIAPAVPQVKVVKAFNLAADTVWRNPPAGLGVPICGDHGVELVAGLVRDLGCEPVAAGGLVRAKLLEATAALAIGIWVGGGDVRGMFPAPAAALGTIPPG